MNDIEALVAEFGERYRKLISSAISFLDEKEPEWDLPSPIDRREWIAGLIRRQARRR
jgi:hypothetical protein